MVKEERFLLVMEDGPKPRGLEWSERGRKGVGNGLSSWAWRIGSWSEAPRRGEGQWGHHMGRLHWPQPVLKGEGGFSHSRSVRGVAAWVGEMAAAVSTTTHSRVRGEEP